MPSEFGCKFLPQGALLQEFRVDGHNIVLGFPEAALYKTNNTSYFGETIGRTTNRIQDAKIVDVNNRTYHVAKNNGRHSLHGGSHGWGKKLFEGPSTVLRNGKECTRCVLVSEDGDEGYPGTVECRVWYSSWVEDQIVVLDVEYEVALIGDECNETIVGMTNHRYSSS